MKVENARWIENAGHPLLMLTIDGKEALVTDEDRGLGAVMLHPAETWKHLPEVVIPETTQHQELRMQNTTRDPVVLALFQRFAKANRDGSWEPGADPWPEGLGPAR